MSHSLVQGRKSMFKHGGDNIGEKYTPLWDVFALLGGFRGMPPPTENFFLNGAFWCIFGSDFVRNFFFKLAFFISNF